MSSSPEPKVRIIVVHGRGTKPPKDCKLRYVRQVLTESVRRVNPKMGQRLARHPETIELAYYADLTRKVTGEKTDSCGSFRGPIRRLFQESRSCPTWVSFRGFLKDLGADMAGQLTRFLSLRFRHQWIKVHFPDVERYLCDAHFAATIRRRLKKLLIPALRRGNRILLIAHSLGSVVAYDALWELSFSPRERLKGDDKVDHLLTLGSPLGDETVKKHLLGWRNRPARRFPTKIRCWSNFSARGDMICYDARIGNDFRPMKKQELLHCFQERADLCNVYRGRDGQWNPHKLYGYLILPEVGELIARFLKDALQ